MKHSKSSCAVVALAIVICALPAMAGEGRTPIWEPTVITTPGKYVVTRNISAPITVIEILVSGVDIDLNGMVVETVGAPTPTIDGTAGVGGITIRNGTVVASGPADAISLAGGKSYTVEDVDIPAGGGVGIRIEGPEVQVRRNSVADRGLAAILVAPGASPFTSGTIEENVVQDNGEGILVVMPSSMGIRHNRVERTLSGFGIRVEFGSAVLLERNTVQEARTEGIVVEASLGCKLYNNVVTRSGGPGIALFGSSESFLLDNVVSESAKDGMIVDGERNHVKRNTLNGNGTSGTGYGLVLSGPGVPFTEHVFGGNMARGNTGGPPCAFTSPPDFCDMTATHTSVGDNFMPFLL